MFNYKVFILSLIVSLGNGETIPTDCVSWFDGCNECSVTDGKLDECTEMGCPNRRNSGYCTDPKPWTDEPAERPAGCLTWFDGCNTCIYYDNILGECTANACRSSIFAKAYCTEESAVISYSLAVSLLGALIIGMTI